MLKIPLKRSLFAAAAASSLAAVLAPQAASAAQVQCNLPTSCATPELLAPAGGTMSHTVTAQGIWGIPVGGSYEIRRGITNVRVGGGTFYGSRSSSTGGLTPAAPYYLRVEAFDWTLLPEVKGTLSD